MSRSDELLADLRGSWPPSLGPPEALRTSADAADKVAYARDLWPRHHMDVRAGRPMQHQPGLIVWPTSTREVQAIVRWAAERRVPLVPFGAGSGVCGGVLPDSDTVVLDLKRMDRVRHLDEEAHTVDVEAGALGLTFENELGRRGFTLGHFPSSILCSTVGGWVAARSAGQCSGHYGKIEDMVVALECVTGEGDVATLHRRVHGPDLTPLVIGSEGVLGVITAATLRLHPAPDTRRFAAYTFDDTQAGWEGMRTIFQEGIRPSVSRLYDPFDAMLARLGGVRGRKHDGTKPEKTAPLVPGLGAAVLRTALRTPGVLNGLIDRVGGKALGGAMLVLVFEGASGAATTEVERAHELLVSRGGRSVGEDPARRWFSHRYAVSYRQAPVYAAGAWVDTLEVAATWDRIGPLYDGVRRALGEHAFVMAHLSHAYPDGCCIYFSFAGSAEPRLGARGAAWDDASVAAYEAAWAAALATAEAAGGTIAHHHGVGRSKAPRLAREAGSGLDVVRSIKRALDPSGVMNPGNLFPPDAQSVDDERPRFTVPPGHAAMSLDRASLLADLRADASLSAVEGWLTTERLTLGLDRDHVITGSVGDWIERGAPGARPPWLDPADHLVAGFVARFHGTNEDVVVRPAPRRAVGPDLFSLVLGMKGRFAKVSRVWVRVHRRGGVPSTTSPYHGPAEPPPNEGEERMMDAIAKAIAGG